MEITIAAGNRAEQSSVRQLRDKAASRLGYQAVDLSALISLGTCRERYIFYTPPYGLVVGFVKQIPQFLRALHTLNILFDLLKSLIMSALSSISGLCFIFPHIHPLRIFHP